MSKKNGYFIRNLLKCINNIYVSGARLFIVKLVVLNALYMFK